MNLSVYLFGDLGSGYTQYPDDYTNTIFGTFYKNAQATTQIAIHREGDLMYYGYIRKLEESNYIGLCAIVNGKMISQVSSLFSIFEKVIESMVRNGYLIHFNDKGDITAKLNQLYENEEEINLITSSIQSSFNRIESTSKELPPVSYSTSKDSIKSFSIQDDETEIIKSSYTNGYTFIYKSKGFNTAQMNSYKGIISRKENEISELKKENERLKNEASKNTNLTSATKNSDNSTLWIWVGVGIFAFLIVIYSMKSNGRKEKDNYYAVETVKESVVPDDEVSKIDITPSIVIEDTITIDEEEYEEENSVEPDYESYADDHDNLITSEDVVTNEDEFEVKNFIIGYYDAVINGKDYISYFEYDDITFFDLKHVKRDAIIKRLSGTNKYKTSREFDWNTLVITPQPSGALTCVFTSDYYIHYNSRTDKYLITTEMTISPNWRIQSINDIETIKVGSIKNDTRPSAN